jgi:hypothetical protein
MVIDTFCDVPETNHPRDKEKALARLFTIMTSIYPRNKSICNTMPKRSQHEAYMDTALSSNCDKFSS